MIAYSKEELYNCHILEESREAFSISEISAESLRKIEQTYSCKLYNPNFFIAIALGLLTILAVVFTALLLGFIASVDVSSGLRVICLIMATVSYFILEIMVKSKKYFNAGVDNALMILILAFTWGVFISSDGTPYWILMNSVLMLISLWLSIRFADSFMAIATGCFFFVLCFLLFTKSGGTAIPWFAFVMMLVTTGMYYLVQKMGKITIFVYEKCLTVLTVFLLIAFYASGNYWVIKELQGSVNSRPVSVSFGWVFWICTFLIPILYIVFGIVKKEILHLRTGIILVIMSVLTYKYYYTLLPVEVEMLLLGLLLIAICYFLIKWLQPGRYGFTSEAISPRPSWKNIEALVIAETMVGNDAPKVDNLLAGGSGGGGGASGEF
jgi:hypothetical protein